MGNFNTFRLLKKAIVNMKKINIEDVLASLEKIQFEIKLSAEIIEKAGHPIFRMLDGKL